MRERGSLGRRANRGGGGGGGGGQRSLSFVPEFPASRWPAVRGGNPGGCSSRMAMPGAASSRAGRGQRASEEARKRFERGMRGLRARRGERNGGLHRGGPVRPALRLLCAPSPKSATPSPGTGTTRLGRARSVAGNRVRVFGLLPALLEGWETRVRGLGLDASGDLQGAALGRGRQSSALLPGSHASPPAVCCQV